VLQKIVAAGAVVSTTTICIEDDLMKRVAAAAEHDGKTSHGFIVDAITQTVEQAEQNDEFHRVADGSWAKILATGKTVSWDETRSYLIARARGETPCRPRARESAR
jgi:predicted transcriptional regulator